MALQAEERRLLRRDWTGPGQIRYGCMEREARAALHLGLRVAAGAVDLCRVTGQRGVAARALELTRDVHRGRSHRVHAPGTDREVRVGIGHGDRSTPAIRVALQTGARVVGSRGVLDEDSDAGVVRDHAVLRLAMAGVANERDVGARYGERVPERVRILGTEREPDVVLGRGR